MIEDMKKAEVRAAHLALVFLFYMFVLVLCHSNCHCRTNVELLMLPVSRLGTTGEKNSASTVMSYMDTINYQSIQCSISNKHYFTGNVRPATKIMVTALNDDSILNP